MKILIYMSLAILIQPITTWSQPGIDFLHCYGSSGPEYSGDVFATSDSAFLMVGTQSPPNADLNQDSYVVKVDSEGRVIWEQTYGRENGPDVSLTVIEADNGDFMVGGLSLNEACIYRISPDGELRWFRTYGSRSIEAIIELKNGDFVATGLIRHGYPYTALLMRIDADGEVVWRREYEFLNGHSYLYGLRETDGGVIVAGYAVRTPPFVQYQMVAQKVNLDGETVWTRLYGLGANTSEFAKAICSAPGGFIIVGRSFQGNGRSLLVRKINNEGEELWTENQDFGFGSEMQWEGCTRLRNDDVIMVGWASRNQEARPIAQVISPDDDVRWSSVYDMNELGDFDPLTNRFTSVVASPDGGVLACGYVFNSPQVNGYDLFAMKLEPLRLDPMIIAHFPTDTMLTVLLQDSIRFLVLANDQRRLDLSYLWLLNENDALGQDTTVTIQFDQLGEQIVECRVSNEEFSTTIRWHITVTDLFISAFTPDTLDLALRRGTSVDFSLDIVRYTPDGDPEYLWRKTNLDNQGEQEDAGTEPRTTIEFLQSGNYAVEGLVYREQSSDEVVWNVAVKGAIWSFAPEDITLEVLPDSLVRFEVVPSEPDSAGWSITWLVDGEVARFDEKMLEWRFFGEADSCPPHLVQVVVADSVEADTVTWEVVARELGVGNEEVGQAGTHVLLNVSPNPFNSMLVIRYDVGAQGLVPLQLAIYDVSGREVVSLVDGGSSVNPPWLTERNSADRRGSPEETSSATWNASLVPAGVYLVRLQSGQDVSTKKVVLIR